MPPAGSLRDRLLAAAERVARSMNSQEVADTVCALETAGMPPGGSLCNSLCAAAECVSPKMNSQNLANTARALATLDMPPVLSLRDVSRQSCSSHSITDAFRTYFTLPQTGCLTNQVSSPHAHTVRGPPFLHKGT
jgi:hypothetical protein